jgi:hypothetical protein
MAAHKSDSAEQRRAESFAIASLSGQLGGTALAPEKLPLGDDGVRVHVDGYREGPPAIIAGVFARQGTLKAGQKHKLMSDAIKLVALGRLHPGATLILVLTDDDAAEGIRRGWRGAALDTLGIEVRTLPLPADVAARVLAAQTRQRMVNDRED